MCFNLQLSARCIEMFVGIVAEMKLTINYNPEGQERILKLEDWIERLRIQL